MGSPLSPVICKIYMEGFENIFLNSSAMKSSVLFMYTDDRLSFKFMRWMGIFCWIMPTELDRF